MLVSLFWTLMFTKCLPRLSASFGQGPRRKAIEAACLLRPERDLPRELPVGVHCEPDVCVPESRLDQLRVRPGLDVHGNEGAAKVVGPNPGDPQKLEGRLCRLFDHDNYSQQLDALVEERDSLLEQPREDLITTLNKLADRVRSHATALAGLPMRTINPVTPRQTPKDYR